MVVIIIIALLFLFGTKKIEKMKVRTKKQKNNVF